MNKVYFCRAMDTFEIDEIKEQYVKVNNLLSNSGLELVNKFDDSNFMHVNEKSTQEDISNNANRIVNNDLDNLKKTDFVIVDLSLENHFYFGCICEIVYAHLWKKKVIVFTGKSKNESRLWLHYHADYICENLENAIEYIVNYKKEMYINNE